MPAPKSWNVRVAPLQLARLNLTVSQRKYSMATTAKTEEKATVIVTVSAKVVEAIKNQLEAQTIATSRKVQTAQAVTSEASRLGYDKAQARQMVTLSWRKARGFTSTDEKEIAAFDLSGRPDVSKVMLLAFPDATTAPQLALAIAHNEKNPSKVARIGENRLLEIARGNQTFADAKAGKAIVRSVKDAPASKLPIADQFGNAIAALRKQFCDGEKGSLSLGKAREIAAAGLADTVSS